MDTCCSYAHLITTLGSSSEVQYIQHFSIFIDRYLKSWKALGFHHVDPFLQRLSSYDLALSCKCSAVLFEIPTVAVSQIIPHVDNDSSPMIQRGVRAEFWGNYPFFTNRQTAKISSAPVPVESDTKLFACYVSGIFECCKTSNTMKLAKTKMSRIFGTVSK